MLMISRLQTGQLRTVTSLASDTSSVTLKSTDLLPDGTSPSPATTSPIVSRAVPLPEETSNPWLAPTSTAAASTTKKKHEVAVGKDSADAEKSKNKLKKRGKKREEEREKAKEDAVVDVEMASVMTLGTAAPAATGSSTSAGPSTSSSGRSKAKAKKGKKAVAAADDEDDESDGNSEVDAQEAALQRMAKGKAGRKDVQAFQQRDLVARAFAGDNVVRVSFRVKSSFDNSWFTHVDAFQEFADEKRREMDSDAPKEIDTTLAGWVRRTYDISSHNLRPMLMLCMFRVHGEAQAHAKPLQNPTSSRKWPAWTRSLAQTTASGTSSSPRSGTRRRPSTKSRTCRTRTPARRSSNGAWTPRLGRSGIRELGSRGGRCPRLSKRCVIVSLLVQSGDILTLVSVDGDGYYSSRKVVLGVTFAFSGLFTFPCIIYHRNMYFFIALSRPINLLGMAATLKTRNCFPEQLRNTCRWCVHIKLNRST